jgi:hypothetical protein
MATHGFVWLPDHANNYRLSIHLMIILLRTTCARAVDDNHCVVGAMCEAVLKFIDAVLCSATCAHKMGRPAYIRVVA